ncbi:MAG: hypothetical protein AB1631_27700 [Acidobacteriota bacterium]
MAPEQMERAIESLLNSQAQNAADIGKLTADVSELTNTVTRVEAQMAEGFMRLEAQAESDRAEIREAIENLIIANEVTRKLSEDVTRLEVQTSQRVTEQGKEIAALVEHSKKTDSQIAALSEQSKETDARLNILINIVERHVTNAKAHECEE